jgi:hypothetical protein
MTGSADKFTTDIRVELISTVIYLAEMQKHRIVVSSEDLGSDALNQRFAGFVNHPAVAAYPALWDLGIWWDEIPRLAIHLTGDIHLVDSYYGKDGVQFLSPDEKLLMVDFVSHLRDFYTASRFSDYYRQSLQENSDFLALLNGLIAEHPLQSILEDYIGLKVGKVNFRLMNLLKSSFGVWTGDMDNRQVYSFCSRHWLLVGQRNKCLKLNLYHTIWHEFMHSVINPLSDKLFPDETLANEEQMTWYCALNESIIWAVTHRLCHSIGLSDDSDNELYFTNSRRNKAPKAEQMFDVLKDYDNCRDKYRTIADFYPVLQSAFGNPPE